MGLGFGQVVGVALAAWWYSQPGVLSSSIAQWLLPVLIYLLYSFLDGSEKTAQGRYWPGFQLGWLCKAVLGPKGYMRGQVVYDDAEALQATRQAIFGAFPHGVVSFHHVLLASDADGFVSRFPQLACHQRRDLAASICFKIPIWRELLLWLGGVDAGRSTAQSVLRNGWSLYILPGGEMEQMLTREGEHHVFLSKRKGFVRLALEHGVDLIPVYAFGETDLYSTYSLLFSLRLWICKNLRVALPLARGVGPTLVPRPRPVSCVVGKPLRVDKSACPSNITVDNLHARFTRELQQLFEKHKAACGCPNAKLVIH
mmetsp:Transcript_28309/g.53925  ORF Transcript_28309/g.53925 Transcript_28309/m.53925 type:complete len:313 (+) Transcript_28309:208-1146(+)